MIHTVVSVRRRLFFLLNPAGTLYFTAFICYNQKKTAGNAEPGIVPFRTGSVRKAFRLRVLSGLENVHERLTGPRFNGWDTFRRPTPAFD